MRRAILHITLCNHVIYIVHSSGPIDLNDWAAQYSVCNVPCDVCISCTVYRLYNVSLYRLFEYDGVC